MNVIEYHNEKSAAKWSALAAILGSISVAMGAFAAHGLKGRLSEYQLGIVETAAKYQMYHALAMLLVAIFIFILGKEARIEKHLNTVCYCLFLGTLLFSGSLYLLAFTGLKWFAFITPIGGVFYIVGWLWLAFLFFSFRKL